MLKNAEFCDEKSLQTRWSDGILKYVDINKGGMILRKFFGGLFIENELLHKEGIYHPIKLDYYKIINKNSSKKEKLKY